MDYQAPGRVEGWPAPPAQGQYPYCQYPTPGPPTPPPPRKRPIYKRWWFWAAIVVFIILAAAAAGASGGAKNRTATLTLSPTTTTLTSQANSGPPSSAGASSASASTAPASTAAPVPAVGVTLPVDFGHGAKANITLHGINQQSTADEFLTPPPGQHVATIDVEIAVATGSVPTNPLYFEVQTGDGHTYDAALAGGPDPQLESGQLNVGDSTRGNVSFFVPDGQQVTKVVLTDAIFRRVATWVVS